MDIRKFAFSRDLTIFHSFFPWEKQPNPLLFEVDDQEYTFRSVICI